MLHNGVCLGHYTIEVTLWCTNSKSQPRKSEPSGDSSGSRRLRSAVGAGNLNTHKLGSLYDAFKPTEARRIAKRLEFHYTPLHGSWLNMAEIELSVFSNQCLNRRISDEVILKREVSALERKRNEAVAVIDWRFSTQDARTKLQHIYPSYSDLKRY